MGNQVALILRNALFSLYFGFFFILGLFITAKVGYAGMLVSWIGLSALPVTQMYLESKNAANSI